MPIEIKELHIRVTVSNPQGNQPTGSGHVESAGRSRDDSDSADAIVAECVEQVVRILQSKAER